MSLKNLTFNLTIYGQMNLYVSLRMFRLWYGAFFLILACFNFKVILIRGVKFRQGT